MKKIILFFGIFASSLIAKSQSLAVGNIVALRVGDSIATLTNTGNTIALDQFNTTGTYINSILLPKTGTNAVCLGGTAASEGLINLSGDKTSIVLMAYRTTAPFSSTINTSTSLAVNRVVVSVNASGIVSLPSITSTSFSAGNIRHVHSNGSQYWAGGSNTGIVWGSNTSNLDTIVTNSSTNTRFITNAGSQLYYSTASATIGIWRLGTGVPKNSGAIATPYINTSASGTGTASPYGFAMKFDSLVCYIADDRLAANGGGIQKWIRTGSVWTLSYTFGTGTGSLVGARGLTVNWNTTPATIFAVTADATLNRIVRINDTSSSVQPVLIATSATSTLFRGVSFTPGTNSLPVKLVNFTASLTNNQTALNWTTASEINNKGFQVEKSNDGKNFSAITFVSGAGNTNRLMNYTYNDDNKLTAFYRLKQIDFDGKFEYSNIVKVSNDELLIDLNPNPFSDDIVLSSPNKIVNAEIIDMNGKTKIMEIVNSNKVTINTSALSNGIYFIRVNDGKKVITKRIIKN